VLSFETVSMQVAKMIGPVLAGVGLARFGPVPCFIAVALLYAVGLLFFIGLPARIGGRPVATPRRSPGASAPASARPGGRRPCGRC